ncbi:HAD superfamily hydrolase [Spirochaetia bacterium]|nr:HAD superfamily hydrolase [Spirochaetia bacterium]
MDFIIFDLDDTLYPQIEYDRGCLMNTVNYVSELCGICADKVSAILNRILNEKGIEYRQIYNDLFDEIKFDGMPHIKEILTLYWQAKPDITVYPDVYFVLDQLKCKYRLAMITDGYPEVQKYKIDKLGLTEYFECVYITDIYGIDKRKPSEYVFELFLRENNIAAEKCVYIGNDPQKDFLPAKKLGMHTVRIRQGSFKNMRLDDVNEAEETICSVTRLSDCLL